LDGCELLIKSGILCICDCEQKLLAKVEHGKNRLCVLELRIARSVCLAATKDDEAWRWHEQFGHQSFDALASMARHDMGRGLPLIEESATFVATQKEDCWQATMLEEMGAIMENNTWGLVDPRPIELKWMYKVKKDEKGNVMRYKARLAKRYVQRNISVDEVFAHVAHMDSITWEQLEARTSITRT
jgi:hypothetical protein